jgi:hypothetical protein
VADDATITVSALLLPDEIAATITGSMTVTPADSGDKWYYKLTSCTATSTDLIAGYFLDDAAVDDDTAPTAVHADDKVKFLFIKNTSTVDGLYICFDGGTAAYNLVDGLFIGPSQTWFGQLPNTTVANLHAISADIDSTGEGSITLIVAAIIDDVA